MGSTLSQPKRIQTTLILCRQDYVSQNCFFSRFHAAITDLKIINYIIIRIAIKSTKVLAIVLTRYCTVSYHIQLLPNYIVLFSVIMPSLGQIVLVKLYSLNELLHTLRITHVIIRSVERRLISNTSLATPYMNILCTAITHCGATEVLL